MGQTGRHTKAEVVSDFRRKQILEAARQNFIRHGVARTTVAGIARSAGVAKGTVYLYYTSKDALLRQLLSADLAELHDDTVPAITQPGSIDERLRRFFTAALAFYDRKRDFIDHCQMEMTPDVRKKARHQLGLVFAAQTDAWQSALVAAGVVRASDRHTASAIVCLAHGLAVHRLKGWHTTTVADAVESATALVLKGVRRK